MIKVIGKHNKHFCSSHPFFSEFLIAMTIAMLIMMPSSIRFHGLFVIRGDYVDQYLTRLLCARRMLRGGYPLGWDWTSFLGAPFFNFGAYLSFDTISLIVPEKYFLLCTGLANVLRFSVASVSSFAYFKRFTTLKYAQIGGLLYSFSSYSLVSLEFSQFLSAVAVFPLLLLAIELFFVNSRRWGIVVACAINAYLCSYLFIQSTIFLLIYVSVRSFSSDGWKIKRPIQTAFYAIVEYLIGILLAGLATVPFVYSVLLSNSFHSRIDEGFQIVELVKLFLPTDLLDVLSGLFLAGASNRFDTFGRDTRWLFFAAYIPVFGMVLSISYLKKSKLRTWQSKLTVICLFSAMLPLFNNAFNLYTAHYTRWWYALVFALVLVTIIELEYSKESRRSEWLEGIWISIAIIIFIIAVSEILLPALYSHTSGRINGILQRCVRKNNELSTERIFQIFSLSITAGGLILTALFMRFRCLRENMMSVIICSIIFYGMSYIALNNTDDYLFNHFSASHMTLEEMIQLYFHSSGVTNHKLEYNTRVDYSPQLNNYGVSINESSVSSFNSELTGEIANFVQSVGFKDSGDGSRRWIGSDDEALRALLSVKYYYNYYPNETMLFPVPKNYRFVEDNNGIPVYETSNYLPFGFVYDSYCTQDDLTKEESIPLQMLNTLVVDKKDEDTIAKYIPKWNGTTLSVIEAVDHRKTQVCDTFVGSAKGFVAQASFESDSVLFFSVPYAQGWHAYVNGKEVRIICANIGFMALVVPEGDNLIEFVYHNPAVPWIVVSISLGICLSGFYATAFIRKKKNEELDCQP